MYGASTAESARPWRAVMNIERLARERPRPPAANLSPRSWARKRLVTRVRRVGGASIGLAVHTPVLTRGGLEWLGGLSASFLLTRLLTAGTLQSS